VKDRLAYYLWRVRPTQSALSAGDGAGELREIDVSKRAHNFCAGPAALPEAVLLRAQAELLDWQGRGLSVMEMSHRSDEYVAIAEKAEQDLRDLLSVPNDYKVLFLQGGASQQFAEIPLNLLPEDGIADYIDTGIWSKKAIDEAQRFGNVNIAASAKAYDYFAIPGQNEWQLSKEAAYLHYASNETIGGIEFDWIPEVGDVPLVADMSSDILSRQLDVSKFGLIYAGAQKNIGPSGLVLVIVREDLLGRARSICPTMLNYKIAADNGSMYNTPATFSWYLSGLVFEWLKEQGGVEAMERINRAKKNLLYKTIDDSPFYSNPIAPNARSWMNVPFTIPNPDLEKTFCAEAAKAGLANLEGHRSVGGMRASIYNAMPLSGVEALVAFMKDFQQRHG
jgi:phosphoserine aminotransferase